MKNEDFLKQIEDASKEVNSEFDLIACFKKYMETSSIKASYLGFQNIREDQKHVLALIQSMKEYQTYFTKALILKLKEKGFF